MTNIFIDEKDSFDVKVYYTISDDANRMLVYGESEVDEERAKEMKHITFTFRRPDWITSRAIMRSCRMHAEGEILVDVGQLNASLFQFLCKDWDLVDGEGKEVEFSYEKMTTVRPDIARCACNEVQTRLIEEGIWSALIDS